MYAPPRCRPLSRPAPPNRMQEPARRNSRIALALQGRRKSLETEGVDGAAQGRGGGAAGEGGGGGADVALDTEFTVLPVLEEAVLHRLEDDLVDGVYVTYHKMCE